MSAARLRRVARLVEDWVNHGVARTLAVAVARRGVVVLHEAFGPLGPEPDSPPVSRESLYCLASIAKPITATAILGLVEDGLLGLNRPVADYLPEFVGEGKDAVTIFHLLTHTSGLREDDVEAHAASRSEVASVSPPAPEGPHPPEPPEHTALAAYLRLRYDAPLWKPPGVEMSYCDFNFELLGEIVRRVSGQRLAAFAHERIFAPLGMRDTSYALPDAVASRAVRRAPDDVRALWTGSSAFCTPEFARIPWASAGVFSTALDLARFGQMFLDPGVSGDARVLSPASVAQMTRNQIPGVGANIGEEQSFPEASWGLGWAIHGDVRFAGSGSLHSPAAFWHSGSGGAHIWVDPVYELVGSYLSIEPHPLSEISHVWPLDLFINAVTAAVLDG
jgi:serine-type D-Ala-D-Ala carboxypeptidase